MTTVPEREIYDITRPLQDSTPVWPGDPLPSLAWVSLLSAGDAANISTMRMSVHTGTHADAPFHVAAAGLRIGEIPLSTFVGPARLVDAATERVITGAMVRQALDMEPRPKRILFHTAAWSDPGEFPTRYTFFDGDAVDELTRSGVLLVGTDAPSVDPFESPGLPAHRHLAAAGVVILENLLLDAVPPGEYELIALPLRLTVADGSPIRALLRRP